MSTATLRDENERLKGAFGANAGSVEQTSSGAGDVGRSAASVEVILGELRREKFGSKSEKLRPDPYHLALDDVEIAQGVLDAAQEKAAAVIRKQSRAGSDQDRHRNRGYLPAHLCCPCGGGPMTKIGEDVNKRLEGRNKSAVAARARTATAAAPPS
ncbi:hypothetical protein ACVMB0_000044 [Bradyrhizobium sp. USDA 4451]